MAREDTRSPRGRQPLALAGSPPPKYPLAPMKKRILSGMRPTGKLHLGHYWGVLQNWVALQEEYECFFMIADWHALTSEWMHPGAIPRNVREIAADWIAA